MITPKPRLTKAVLEAMVAKLQTEYNDSVGLLRKAEADKAELLCMLETVRKDRDAAVAHVQEYRFFVDRAKAEAADTARKATQLAEFPEWYSYVDQLRVLTKYRNPQDVLTQVREWKRDAEKVGEARALIEDREAALETNRELRVALRRQQDALEQPLHRIALARVYLALKRGNTRK